MNAQAEGKVTKELVDREVTKSTTSYENEVNLLCAQLEVEANIKKESLFGAFNDLIAEEIKKIGLKCVTEVRLVSNNLLADISFT